MAMAEYRYGVTGVHSICAESGLLVPPRRAEPDVPRLSVDVERESIMQVSPARLQHSAGQLERLAGVPGPSVVRECAAGQQGDSRKKR